MGVTGLGMGIQRLRVQGLGSTNGCSGIRVSCLGFRNGGLRST